MARTDNFKNFATDVADSIREMTGETGLIPASEFDTKIKSIETKGDFSLQDKSIEITENGTTNITADEGYDGLNNVEVVTNVESTGSGTVSTERIIDFSSLSTENISVKQDGTTATYGNWYLYNYIALDDYEKIKYSNVHCFYSSDNGLYLYGIIFYDENKNFISGIGLNEADNSIHSNTIASSQGENGYLIDGTATIPSNAVYMRTTYTNIAGVIFIPNISLIKGETSGGGETPEKGLIINQWDSEGYPTKVTILGLSSLPVGIFAVKSSSTANTIIYPFLSKIEECILPTSIATIPRDCFYENRFLKKISLKNVTKIETYAFYNCSMLELDSLPDGLKTLYSYTFQYCSMLSLRELPESITEIQNNVFYNCTNMNLHKLPTNLTTLGTNVFYENNNADLKTIPVGVTVLNTSAFRGNKFVQMSIPNVTTISGASTTGSFYNCTNLKAVWIGSSITSSGFARYAFRNCSQLQKMFIDLPRATVESFTNYQYAFMNDTSKTGIIVCNDDEDFMTKEEFDAIDWATYSE